MGTFLVHEQFVGPTRGCSIAAREDCFTQSIPRFGMLGFYHPI